MDQAPKYFSLDQANAIVKAISPMLAEVLEIRQVILESQPKVWPVIESAAGNGGSMAASQITREFQRLDLLVREIKRTGAILKDINNGLVDFLAKREGRDIYLCWQYGEDSVLYWHEIDDGYKGRQFIH